MQARRIPAAIQAVTAAFRAALEARFGARLRELQLFGSYARGDAGPESDVDVLVVIEDLARLERNQTYEIAADLYADHALRVSPLALSSEDYAALRDREYLIAKDIAREGIPL